MAERKVNEAQFQEYMQKSGASALFSSMMEKMLLEKPADPLNFLINHLQNEAAAKAAPAAEAKADEGAAEEKKQSTKMF